MSKNIDEKWQQKWFGQKVFEPEHSEKKKFFFTIPYPYVSGTLHVGHGRTYTNGDILARFKRMRGFNVLWPMAFHITGTPVLAISSKIAAGDEKTISLYHDYVGIYEKDSAKVGEIVKSFVEPWNIVKYFASKLINDFKSIGFSLDLSRQFTTGDLEYNQFVEWQFRKYKQKGYLKQGSYPILYCPKDENAVGEDDIQDADTNSVSEQEFVWGKFRLNGSDLILMAGTTRPDAFYGQTHLWVDPNATYPIVQVGNEKWVVGREAFEKIKYHYPQHKPKIIGEISSKELMGKWVRGPIVDYDIYIVPGWFIHANVGSGIVYSALEDPVDLFELKKIHDNMDLIRQYHLDEKIIEKLKPVSIIEVPGMGPNLGEEIGKEFHVKSADDRANIDAAKGELNKRVFRKGIMKSNCGECAGMSVPEAQKYLIKTLVEKNDAAMFYEPSREAYCRCGAKVIVAILNDQWFIDFNSPGWKELATRCLSEMKIFPEVYRKHFEDTFNWLDKRPAVRKRGLGTKLPFDQSWIIESLSDSTIYMAFYTVIKKIRELKMAPEELTEEFFDYVFSGKGKGRKEWASVRKEFEYWYPNNLRHTAIAHITNHLSFMIFAHTAVFDKKHWPGGFSLNEMLISEGKKMSKSKGNVVMLNEISRTYGADAFRMYVSSAADFSSVLDFRRADAANAKKHVERFYELASNAVALLEKGGKKRKSHLTKWIISSFERKASESTELLEKFEVRDYILCSFYKLMNDVEYFWKKSDDEEKREAMGHMLDRWIRMLAPVMPHICEELWEKLGKKGFVSLSEWPNADESLIDAAAESGEALVQSIVQDTGKISALLGKKPSIIYLYTAAPWKYALHTLARMEKDFSAIMKQASAHPILKHHMADVPRIIKSFGKHINNLPEVMALKDESAVLVEAQEFLSKELGCVVHVLAEGQDSKHPKAKQAMPGKPALVLE